nr:SUMF1/EgtB/PvdO family nonheme iron enzyme [uncultured Rhodoferax sp.]
MFSSKGLIRWGLATTGVLYLLFGLTGCGGSGGATGNPAPVILSLAPPAKLTADAGKQRVTLNWSNVPSATSFTIYYGNTPGISKSSPKITDAHSIYIMRDLSNGTPYFFAIATMGATGEGALSAEVSATPTATPPQPAPVTLRAEAGNKQVQLSWEPGFDATSDPTSYTVYYDTTSALSKLTSKKLTSAVSPQTVPTLVNGTTYYFAVTATTANGESALSYTTSAMPVATAVPAAPAGLKALEGNGSITLNWNPSAGATSYNLYYGTEFDVTKANGIKVTGVSSPFTLQGLTNKTAYFLVVSAVGPGGEGFETPQVSATPLANTPIQAMMHIPAGTFQMGDNMLDPSAPAPYATPVHNVSLSAFSMERFEISYTQWRTVYDWAITKGYTFDSAGRNGALQLGTNMPVTQINWYDTVKWLNARSEKEGRSPVYFTDASHTTVYRTGNIDLSNDAVDWLANGYRLPTDAEWEYASRGGLVGKPYPWGDVLDATKANFDRGTSTSIGSYAPNGYGLYDTAGNVWEWTWDHDSTNYSASAAGVTNPHGPLTGLLRVRRGGSYVYGERYLRNFDKMFRSNNYSGPYFGFRAASSQP